MRLVSFTPLTSVNLAIPADEQNQFSAMAQAFDLTGANGVRYVKLDIQSSYGGLGGLENYVGLSEVRFEDLRDLTLMVNTTSGSVSIANNAPGGDPIELDAYFLESDEGSLNPAGFQSLEDRPGYGNGNPDDGIGWEVLGTPSTTGISEANLTGSSLLDVAQSVSLGNVFSAGSDQDLVFYYALRGQLYQGLVEYVMSVLQADFDMNDGVDGNDFLIWQQGFNQFAGNATRGDGDADGNGFVNGDDLDIWQQEFGSGAGGAGLATDVAVPEPAAVMLLLLCGGLLLARRALR